jgi:hypothetical protein
MKGIRVCIILFALLCGIITSQNVEENFLANSTPMLGAETSSPAVSFSEEEHMLITFLENLKEDPEDPFAPDTKPDTKPTVKPTVKPSVDPVKPDPKPSVDPKPEPAKPSTMDNLIGAFSKLTNQWGRVIDTFKTTRSSEIKERLIGKGFDAFNQSAQIQIIKGIKEEFFDKYLNHLETRIKVPEERQEDLKMVLEECKWADSNVWSAFNTVFSIDKGGNTKFTSIIVNRNDEKNTYDFVFSDIKADFVLAPDVLVVKKSLSVLGGIWSDDKDEMVKVPKSLNPEDIQAVMSFFQIVAFKGFAEQFGIKLDFPKM